MRATKAAPSSGKLLIKAMGVASFPNDGANLGLLLGALEAAAEQAAQKGDHTIVLAKDL